MSLKLTHICHSSRLSGGYKHERFLSEVLSEAIGADKKEAFFEPIVQSPIGYLELLLFAFKHSASDVNVCVSRTALPALLRPGLRKTLIVMHNWDSDDSKSVYLSSYFNALWRNLRRRDKASYALICISSHWKPIFHELIGDQANILVFPNLIEPSDYSPFLGNEKRNWVYMGQISPKNDYSSLEKLDLKLQQAGWRAFYTTIYPEIEKPYQAAEVLKVDRPEYLQLLANCKYSISFPKVAEGWSRIAHESLILNTPVIGYQVGGLGQLIEESGSWGVKGSEEALEIILKTTAGINKPLRDSFIEKYSPANLQKYLEPIIEFLR